MRAASAVAAALMVLSTGCVTQGTYDKLRAELDGTQNELEARNKKVSELEASNAGLKKTSQDLEAALASEKENLADLQARISRMDQDRVTALKDRSHLQESVAEMTAALADLQKRKEAADSRIAEFRSLLDKFKGLIDAGKLKVRIQEGRMVVVLATDVLFASGSATLSPEGKSALSEVAVLLSSLPKRQFQVEGHTDNIPISTAQYPSNWELAAARAIRVLKTMVDAGLPAGRISAASFGDSKPAALNVTPDGRAQNRRIEITIVPDLSTLPGFDELNRLQTRT